MVLIFISGKIKNEKDDKLEIERGNLIEVVFIAYGVYMMITACIQLTTGTYAFVQQMGMDEVVKHDVTPQIIKNIFIVTLGATFVFLNKTITAGLQKIQQ